MSICLQCGTVSLNPDDYKHTGGLCPKHYAEAMEEFELYKPLSKKKIKQICKRAKTVETIKIVGALALCALSLWLLVIFYQLR